MRGLDTFPKADRTPLAWATRLAFIGMVGIGTGLVVLSLWYWLRRRRNGPGPEDRLTLMALAAAGPLAFLANELGWLVSEFGRQPWVVYGVFRTSSAITTASGLGATFAGFHAPLLRPERGDGVGRAAGLDREPRPVARSSLSVA